MQRIATAVSDRGAVRVLEMHRPAKKNAIDVRMATELARALDEAGADDSVRAIVVTGAGDAYTAGVDLSLFLGQGEVFDDAVPPVDLWQHIVGCPKPVIAAVNGLAVGMGVTLLPLFDMVFASTAASFRLPFVELGLVLEFGSSFTLPRLIGRQRTNELVLRAAGIDADTAERWGLVNRCFAADTFRDDVLRIAEDVARHPPGGVAHCKRLIAAGEAATDLRGCVSAENEVLAGCYGSDENVRAVTELLRRRSR